MKTIPNKMQVFALAMAISLGTIGLFASFMVALLHGAQGDWGYMCVFVVAWSLGGAAIYAVVKNGMKTLKALKKLQEPDDDA